MDKLILVENETAVLSQHASEMLALFERRAKAIAEAQKELKKRLLEEMEANGILSIDNDDLTITYVAPYPKESFDSKAFRKDNPDLYDEYVKISQVSASVRLKVKGEDGKL